MIFTFFKTFLIAAAACFEVLLHHSTHQKFIGSEYHNKMVFNLKNQVIIIEKIEIRSPIEVTANISIIPRTIISLALGTVHK